MKTRQSNWQRHAAAAINTRPLPLRLRIRTSLRVRLHAALPTAPR